MSGISTQVREMNNDIIVDLDRYHDTTQKYLLYTLRSDQATTSFRSSVQDFAQDSSNFGQVTYNPFFATNPDDKSDRGHEFHTIKRTESVDRMKCDFSQPNFPFINGWKGPGIPFNRSGFTVDFPQLSPLSLNDIKYYGTKAIAQCEPTYPAANLSLFLGEIFFADKELPHVSMSDLKYASLGGGSVPKHLGKAAINAEFAWVPFMSDITKAMKAVQNSYKIIAQYRKDSDKIVRRRFKFEPVVDYSESTSSNGDIYSPYQLAEASGSSHEATYSQYLRTEMWFSGAFMYHLPVPDSLLHKFEYYSQLANRVLGSDITPQTLWNLAPWSWLVDWKIDIGSALGLANDMSHNSLVLRYGYLMRRQTAVNKLIIPGLRYIGTGKLGPVTRTLSVVQKERVRATPYGFGINPDQFTTEQNAILLALGLSKERYRVN